MRNSFKSFLIVVLSIILFSGNAFSGQIPETKKLSVEVKDRHITLIAENVSIKEALNAIANKTGITVQIFDGVVDRKVSITIKDVPYFCISTLLEKMGIKNYGVAYEKDTGKQYVYAVNAGTDLTELTKGKTLVRSGNFANGRDVNKVKGKEIITEKNEPKKYSVSYVKDEVLLKFHLGVERKEIDEILKKHNLVAAADNSLSSIG